jgi:hypothetical protein
MNDMNDNMNDNINDTNDNINDNTNMNDNINDTNDMNEKYIRNYQNIKSNDKIMVNENISN